MSNYIGVRCPVCNKKFTEADDIVVCPICGAPHHRGCYAEKNQCAFVEDHLTGKEWSDPAGEVSPHEHRDGAVKACVRCGADNTGDSIFCQICGYPISLQENGTIGGSSSDEAPYQWNLPGGIGTQVDAISMAYGGLKPDDEIDGEPVKDVAKYIGTGSAYYLPRFRLMSEYGRSFMPNFSAFIFSFFFYFYRKMYTIGTVLLVLCAVSVIPDYLYAIKVAMPTFMQRMGFDTAVSVSQAVADHYLWLAGIAQTIRLVIVLIFSIFANRVYYNKVISAVHTIRGTKEETVSEESYLNTLSQAGGTSRTSVAILAAALVAAHFTIVYLCMTVIQ